MVEREARIKELAIAMRQRYGEMINEPPTVPFAKADSARYWLACAEVAYDMLMGKGGNC